MWCILILITNLKANNTTKVNKKWEKNERTITYLLEVKYVYTNIMFMIQYDSSWSMKFDERDKEY